MLNIKPSLLTALVAGFLGMSAAQAAQAAQADPSVRRKAKQQGVRDIIGPSTSWPGPGTPSRRDRHRAAVALKAQQAGLATSPKIAKPRKHHVHNHPQRDDIGAYTVVGRNAETSTGRRMWVAGISAQRGF